MKLSNIDQYQPQIPTITESDRRKLKEQTDAFEAIILKILLDQSIRADDPLLPKDPVHTTGKR